MNSSQYESKGNIQQRDYDILYSLSIITSIILAGVSEAVKKCEMFPGPPLCIQQGGGPKAPINAPTQQAPIKAPIGQQQQAEINSKWLNTFMNLAGIINDKFHNVFENVSISALDNVEHFILGDLGNKQLDKGILDQLQNKTMILGRMTRDPQVQQALKDIAEELSILGIQMLDTMKPTIDRLTDRSIETLNRIATRGAKSIMNTGMNIIEALLGEIPVAGGIIALVMAFLRGFNAAMLTSAPGIEFSTEAFFTAFNTSIKMLQDFLKVQSRLTQQANAVRTAVQNIIPSSKDITDFANKGQELGNAYAKNALNSAKTLSSAIERPLDDLNNSLTSVKNPLTSVKNPLSSVKNPLNSVKNPISSVKNPLTNKKLKKKQDGGRANVQRRIQHITKRLKNTINRFTNNNNKRFTKKIRS
jgi:hypothetical protein